MDRKFFFILLWFLIVLLSAVSCNKEETEEISEAPFYGNWCGPKHSGPAAPADSLDSCCQTHDKCYESAIKSPLNYLECATETPKITCDRQFVQCLQALPADTNQWTTKPADSAKAAEYKEKAVAVFKTCTTLADLFK